jgi:integrase
MPRPRKSSIYERFERHAERTFADAAARYLAEFQGKDKLRSAHCIASVAPYIGQLRLIDVDDEAMQAFKEDRRLGRPPFGKPAMVGTVNKELSQVVTVLNKAARIWRWIPSAPKIEHVRGAVRQAYPFTLEEQKRLFAELPSGWDVGAAVFAVNTGVRKEELFGLKWTDMVRVPELGDGVFVFVLVDTKNGHQRAVICNSFARNAVEQQRKWQAKHGWSTYVFPSRRHGYAGERCKATGRIWGEAWIRAGLPSGPLVKKGIHNCRHTFAHRLRAAGVPQEDRNALLGHANTNLAEHYALPDLERLLAHAEKVVQLKETTVLRVVATHVPTAGMAVGESSNGAA